MWHQGARTALVLCCSLLAACGAKTLDFTGPDGGAGASGTTTAAGGSSGTGGAVTTTGTGGATGGTGGASGGTAGASGGIGGASGGAAGSGGSSPGPFVSSIRDIKVTKIDLLFVIDNSSAMADHQPMLGEAIPELVEQLVGPRCIDPITGRTVGTAVNGVCAVGQLSFQPIKDIHIAVISSSLGAHGAQGVCDDATDGRAEPHNNDRAYLLTRGVGGSTVSTFNNKGFLYFNPAVPGGLGNPSAVAVPFSELVKGVGQHGCRYPAPLEAAYRFLIDPEPYQEVVIDSSIGGYGTAVLNGIDQTLQTQRTEFLRPDSLLSVVLVTNSNDCSVIDGGLGFYPLLPPIPNTDKSVMPRGTSKCLENPNDRCCFSCGVQQPPAGCAPAADDPECMKGQRPVSEDPLALRCFNQKQRYGIDFLYPVQRYIDGFTKPQVPDRLGNMVSNPLYPDARCPPEVGCPVPRDKSMVWVTGIVGVPWQDIAVDPRDMNKGYKPAKQLHAENVWADIVGDPQNAKGPVLPRDPHMIESIQPRAGLAPSGSAWHADPIHGHEWEPSKDPSQPNAAARAITPPRGLRG